MDSCKIRCLFLRPLIKFMQAFPSCLRNSPHRHNIISVSFQMADFIVSGYPESKLLVESVNRCRRILLPLHTLAVGPKGPLLRRRDLENISFNHFRSGYKRP